MSIFIETQCDKEISLSTQGILKISKILEYLYLFKEIITNLEIPMVRARHTIDCRCNKQSYVKIKQFIL